MNNVLLLYPNPLDWASIAAPPYGLEILSASIRDLPVTVTIYNPYFSETPRQSLIQLVETLKPIIIGISVRQLDNLANVWAEPVNSDLEIQIRSFLPEIDETVSTIIAATQAPVIVGGKGFSISPVALLKRLNLKMGVVGPGEITFRELIQAILSGTDIREFVIGNYARLPGIIFFENNQICLYGPAASYDYNMKLSNLERYSAYSARWTGFVPVRVSEGCVSSCSFCVEAKPAKIRWRSPGQVIEEIKQLAPKENKAIWLTCSEFNLPDEKNGLEICQSIIDADLPDFVLSSYFLPTPFSESFYHTLRRAGFIDHSICFNVVHPSDTVLSKNGIPFRRSDIDKLINTLLQAGAQGFCCGLILGLPGETAESLAEAISWVKDISKLFGDGFRCFYNCGGRVYPHTGLWQQVSNQTEFLYGMNDPEFLLPIVYSVPWPPSKINTYFESACSSFPGIVTSYNRGSPLFQESKELIISWQKAHVYQNLYDLNSAASVFEKALNLAKNPIIKKQIALALIPNLIRLNRISEARNLLSDYSLSMNHSVSQNKSESK